MRLYVGAMNNGRTATEEGIGMTATTDRHNADYAAIVDAIVFRPKRARTDRIWYRVEIATGRGEITGYVDDAGEAPTTFVFQHTTPATFGAQAVLIGFAAAKGHENPAEWAREMVDEARRNAVRIEADDRRFLDPNGAPRLHAIFGPDGWRADTTPSTFHAADPIVI